MRLSELESRKKGIIVKINGRGAFRKRIGEMGFIRGREVHVIKNAPLQDPVEYSIMGYRVSLRRAEASLIEIDTVEKYREKPLDGIGNLSYDLERRYTISSERTINIALVGNPNCGKTSIFNTSTRSYGHVGNYGGVTVDVKLARVEHQGYLFNMYDLPGTYSLSSYSPEEVFVRNFLTDNVPDVVVNVVDAANLERNLYLTTQLIDMNIKVVIALNMYDELKFSGSKFNHLIFGTLTGIPVVPTVGTRGKGLARLFDTIIKKHLQTGHNRKKVHINYGPDIEESIAKIRDKLTSIPNNDLNNRICPRYMAIKLLEKDAVAESMVLSLEDHEEILNLAERERNSIEGKYQDEADNVITDYRYGFIAGALKETFIPSVQKETNLSERIDNLLTHKYFGLPIFFFFLWFSFITTFKLGQYPVAWIENGVRYLSSLLNSSLPMALSVVLVGSLSFCLTL
jgi:ferrous iron transport protein B